MNNIYRIVVAILFLVTLPVQLITAGILILVSGRPVLFVQKRIGKGGRPFAIYKFRTMVSDAEARKKKLINRNESDGPVFKIHNDPRFTRVGMFLSHTGLDELPQLYNVLRGDMALIGPRPLPVAESKQLKAWMRARHDILPGIISPAVLTHTYHKNFDIWMKSDIGYTRRKSVREDMLLLFRFVLFIGKLFVREVWQMSVHPNLLGFISSTKDI